MRIGLQERHVQNNKIRVPIQKIAVAIGNGYDVRKCIYFNLFLRLGNFVFEHKNVFTVLTGVNFAMVIFIKQDCIRNALWKCLTN